MGDYQWLFNNGIAVAIVAFVGFVLWRVLVGSKSTGYQGILIRWANNLAQNVHDHSVEATSEFGKARQERSTQVSALQLLVESQSPPIGAAFIAAKAVHHTAENVEQLVAGMHSAKAAMRELTKMCRLVAARFPEDEQAIDRHCDEIERIIGEA
jgi:hypothetical protein